MTRGIHTMAYGTQLPDGQYAIGTLNLLNNPEGTFPIPMTISRRVGGRGDTETHAQQEFRHGEFDFVIQNPPYTKSNTDKNSEVPKTTFGDRDPEVEKAMKKIAQGTEKPAWAMAMPGSLHTSLNSPIRC